MKRASARQFGDSRPERNRRRPMRTRWMVCLGATALLLAAGTGCATSGDLEKLENRVTALEGRVDKLGDVERRAAAAEAAANKAAADAAAAAQRADDANRRAEAMFKKSVSK